MEGAFYNVKKEVDKKKTGEIIRQYLNSRKPEIKGTNSRTKMQLFHGLCDYY